MKQHVAEIVAAYVGKNRLDPSELPALIASISKSLASLGQAPEIPLTPAVPIRQSFSASSVTCLDCGWSGQMLRRHLTTAHGLSAHEYRSRWGLKDTHPLVAPAYTKRRSALAKELGLGRKGRPSSGTLRTVALMTRTPSVDLDPAFVASLSASKRRGRPRRATRADEVIE
jgi:predicted transcriptional regulator